MAQIPEVYMLDRPGEGTSLLLQHTAFPLKLEIYHSSQLFFNSVTPVRPACVILDFELTDATGPDVLAQLRKTSDIPVIMTAHTPAVDAILKCHRLGIVDILTKPIHREHLQSLVQRVLQQDQDAMAIRQRVAEARCKINRLTERQFELMSLFARGLSQKEIAATLHISRRTVENHRARLNARLGTSRLSDFLELEMWSGRGSLPCRSCRHVDGQAICEGACTSRQTTDACGSLDSPADFVER